VFNLVSKSFNFLSPTTTSLVAAEADSEVGLERGVFTPPMAAVASSALAVALGGGAVIGAGMACFASPLLGALGVPRSSALHAPGRAYLLARAVGTPASLALLALQGSFRGARDTATPLRAALIGTAINLALDPLLIHVGLFAWGVAGAAIATSLSQYAGVVLLVRALSRRCSGSLFPPETRRLLGLPAPRRAVCRRVALAGSVLTARTLFGMAAFSYSTVAAGSLGVAAGAAHQVCLQLWFATSLLADAIAIAAQPLLATCLAQRERSGARRVVRQSLLLGAAAGFATAAALAFSGPALCRLFTTDPAALAAATEVWPLVVASQPLNTLAFSVDGLLYGARDFHYCALVMGGASAAAISVMALGRRRLGLNAVWCGLALLMAVRTLGAVGRIASGTGPWAALGPWSSPDEL
jgi:putative MATE family efflux protein